jgi:hypothetical protein
VAGAGNDLTLTSSLGITLVLGNITGVANFTKNGAGGVTITGTLTTTANQVWSDAVTLGGNASTISGAGTITFSTTVGESVVSTLTVQNIAATGTVTFTGMVTLQGLATGAGNYAIALNGGGTITAALTFNNTGGVTISNGLTANLGLTATTAGTNTFQGTVATDGAVGHNISLSNLTVGSGGLTINALGAAGNVFLNGAATISAGDFVVYAANFNTVAQGSITISPSASANTTATFNVTNLYLTTITTITGASYYGIADLVSANFNIGTLINAGYLRLTGTQVTHTFTTYDVSEGTVEYYGTAAGWVFTTGMGNAGTNYYNLNINGTAVFTLQAATVVANNVHIAQGTLSAGAANLSVGGDWQNDVSFAGFTSGTKSVTFTKSSGVISISGDNQWYVFICTMPGVTILFSNSNTQRIATGGIFRVKSSGTVITLSRATPGSVPPNLPDSTNNPSNPPIASDSSYFWYFDLQPGATLDMLNVNVYYSNAESNPISVPAGATATPYSTHFCYKWLDIAFSIYSYTEDSDYNGKIDRIRVTTESLISTTTPDFSGFQVEVKGYDVDTSKGTNGFAVPAPGYTYYIYLKEKPYNDTGVTPDWHVVSNTTFRALSKLVGTVSRQGGSDWMTPGDTAWPRIGYTLSLPGQNSSFVHMSEAVVQGGATPSAGNFGFTGGSITPVTSSGLGIQEAIATSAAAPTNLQIAQGSDILAFSGSLSDLGQPPHWEPAYAGQVIGYPAPTYPPATGYANPNSYLPFLPVPTVSPLVYPTRPTYFDLQDGGLPSTTHRVSDVMLDIPPPATGAYDPNSYFAWPIYAKDQLNLTMTDSEIAALTAAQSAAEGIGLIRAFDGTQWLRPQTVTVQTRVSSALGALQPSIVYDTNVASTYKGSSGVWLPTHAETSFSGLDAYPNTLVGSQDDASSVSSGLWNLALPGTDPKIKGMANNSIFDFFLSLKTAPSDLYVARLDIASGASIPSDWYRHVRPFSFFFHNIVLQRGGATILNNVIDPTKGDTVRLSYQLSSAGSVTVTVFTLDGDVVARLANSSSQAAGDHAVYWDGRNLSGNAVARGLYFIRIVAPGMDEIRKVIVVRK